MNKDELIKLLSENFKREVSLESYYQNLMFELKNEAINSTLLSLFQDTERHALTFSKLRDKITKG